MFCFVLLPSWKLPEEEIVKESNGRIRRKAKWDDGNEENVEEVTLKELDNEDEMDHADDENEGIYSDDEEIEDDEGDERVGEKLSYATRSSKTEVSTNYSCSYLLIEHCNFRCPLALTVYLAYLFFWNYCIPKERALTAFLVSC